MSDFGFPLDAVLYRLQEWLHILRKMKPKYLMEPFWIICPQGMKG